MTWVGRGDLQAKWDSCMLPCLQWGVFQYFRQFCFLTGKPSNSFLTALASQGWALGSVLMLSAVFVAQFEKKHLLLVDVPLKKKERMLLAKETQRSLALGLVMQADLTELGCSCIPQSTLHVPSLNLAQESSCSGEALTALTRAGQGPLSLNPHSQAGSQTQTVSSRNTWQQPSPRATRKDGRKKALRRIKN